MTAKLWITMLGVALNRMHQRRARVLDREVAPGRREPWPGLPIILAILIAIVLGAALVLLRTGVLVLG